MPSQKYIDQTVKYGLEAMDPSVRPLYASAPALLEALEEVNRRLSLGPTFEFVRAAVAQAKGEK